VELYLQSSYVFVKWGAYARGKLYNNRTALNIIKKSAEELKSYLRIGVVIRCFLIRPIVHHKVGDKVTDKGENRNNSHRFLCPRSHFWLSELR
jgi:hypothetical protein